MRHVTVTLTTTDVSDDIIHEQLCLAIHEGVPAEAVTNVGGISRVTPADTGERVASLAGKYGDFSFKDLLKLSQSDETGALEQFCTDVRSMAASLRRQNER